MLLFDSLISFSYLLVLFTFVSAPSPAFAVPSRFPFLLDRFTKQSHIHKRPWTLLRDHVIRRIWSLPQPQDINTCRHNELSKPSDLAREGPPASLLARYGGDVVLRFNISNTEEAEALAEATNVLFLDVWEFTSEWADIRLAKDMVSSLLGLLPRSLEHAHTPLIHDLAQAIYESYPAPTPEDNTSPLSQNHRPFSPTLTIPTNNAGTNIFFSNYRPLSVIKPWMRLMQSLFDTHVRMINIGISYEGREIPALRVGVHPTNSEKPSGPRKTIIISGGSHAREWISTSTVNYVAFSLISSYGKNKEMTKLLEEFDWIFIPTINPDGYVHTWENDRLWRKNRQQTSLRFCRGIDLDRCWGYQWDGLQTKGNPCSESFAGDEPFQAVESNQFAKWAQNETENNNVKFVGFLDLHSYSQQVLYPYSFSCTHSPPSLEDLEELGEGLAKAIRLAWHGENYAVNSACEGSVTPTHNLKKATNQEPPKVHPRLETGGGSALDWFYHSLGVKYAYQIKLRDTGSYGFLLPKENIIPTGTEVFKAVVYFGNFLLGNKGFEVSGEEENEKEKERKVHGMDDTAAAVESELDHKSKSEKLFDALEDIRVDDRNEEVLSEEEEGRVDLDWELKKRRRK
ncbi:MAG: hypothetical protein M1812_006623 [Candelaria pacifica]|nr:MAG: hypothetical protein M1812_006623 [Candelaria pacifica]